MLWKIASLFFLLTIESDQVSADPSQVIYTPPKVKLDYATVTGLTSGLVNHFLGIPFAKPPFVEVHYVGLSDHLIFPAFCNRTGNLRFRLPEKLLPYTTSFSATQYGPACPQQAVQVPPSLNVTALGSKVTSFAEDCLTLNVITPTTATTVSSLPVLVWIFGGGFEVGGTSIYDGSVIVEKGISLDIPVIYVSVNYRLNAFGFLAGQEVKDAGVGNLGLHDQRLALKWVQRYIRAFGGDPTKVTLWGDSAGSTSIALHMMTNGGNVNGLFRAAIMHSGATLVLGDITEGQSDYDALVAETGCSNTTDTLQCLREVPYDDLLHAVNQSPGIFNFQAALEWSPRVDGVFLTADTFRLVQQGSVANIPFITSNCDDEGTLFSFSTLNITTDAQFKEYISSYLIPNRSTAELMQLMTYYPSDPALGSPFDTGSKNALTPQFKRLSAFRGDLTLQAPRRFLTQSLSGKQNIWMYLFKRGKRIPYLGAYHASDVLSNMYTGGDILPYLLRFVTHLDPNVGENTGLYWPKYDATTNQTMMEFLDGSIPLALAMDTFRAEAIAYLTNVTVAG